jgi:hypothetical protein
MNVNDKLKELIEKDRKLWMETRDERYKFPKTRIKNALEFPSTAVLDRRLLSESVPKVDFVAAVLNVLGYDLAIVPQGSTLPAGSIVVDSDFKYEKKPNMARVPKNSEK